MIDPLKVVAYFILRAAYRITFHPLANFPGPKLRGVSHLPHAFSGFKGRQPFDVRDIHKRYGRVVRIAPDTLSFITARSWKDIYGNGPGRPFPVHDYVPLRPDVSDLLTASVADHARQRKAFSHAFSEKAVRGQEPIIASHLDRFIDRLQRRAKEEPNIDIVKWLEFLTFDIIGDLALSTQFGCVENSMFHPWISLLMKVFKAVAYVENAKAFGSLFPLLMLFAPFQDLKKFKDHVRMSAEKVRQRLAGGEDSTRSDIWTYVLRHKDEKVLSVPEMEVNGALILLAGTETMSTALSGTLYLLSTNPEALDRLRNELDSHFTAEADINIAAVAKLPYLQAVLDEGLRMYPPFPGDLKRKVPCGGATVNGYQIPEGVRT